MDSIFAKILRMQTNEKETYWDTKHQTRELTDFEKNCRMRWDDEASRHLWTRYVYPFENDSDILLHNFESAISNTGLLIQYDSKVCENSHEVGRLSVKIEELLKLADKEIDNAQRSKDEAVKMRGKCEDARVKIDQYLSDEKSCNNKYQSLYSQKRSIY